jgi:hypothetical protein
MCGGDLNIIEGASTAECEYCGSVQTIPALDDEKKLIQFERAERLRKQCEFDKAAGIYETIVTDFRQEAEAYWGLVLCKYGIEYVDDPATGKKIPTCHRSSFDSILEDTDFEQALENADAVARKVYREEAKQIEEIRKGIIAVSSNEQPYDIFICYKETAKDGGRTLDSVLAQDVYDALTDKGYRVFFSRITLEDKLGMEYEPYIFAALNSAKIMLAFGTDYEHFNAVWVKNEWSRFLKLMAKDKEKHLIPCYKNIDAYDMPREFQHLQGADMGQMGAIQDLLRNLEKYIPLKKQSASRKDDPNVAAKVQAQLERGWMALEASEWDEADMFFENALNLDPKTALAYVGKMLAEFKLNREESLSRLNRPIQQNKNYIKAMRCADTNLQDRLLAYNKQINANIQTRQDQMDELQRRKDTVLAEIQEANGALWQAEQNTAGIKKRIGQNHAHLLELKEVAEEHARNAEKCRSQRPKNVGNILFYSLILLAVVVAAAICFVNPLLVEDTDAELWILLANHYLIWVVRDLQLGRRIGRILMRTPKLVLKTIISLLIYAIAFSNIYKMVPPSTVMLVYDLPNLYIVICLITQIFALSRYKRLQGHADALAASYQRNYLTESESNPQLQQLTRELEESQNQYRELQKQYKERIAAANQRYLEEAEKNFLPKENLIPSKYQ